MTLLASIPCSVAICQVYKFSYRQRQTFLGGRLWLIDIQNGGMARNGLKPVKSIPELVPHVFSPKSSAQNKSESQCKTGRQTDSSERHWEYNFSAARHCHIITILMRISAKEGSYNRYHCRDHTGVEARAHTRNGQDYEASNISFRDHCGDERESLPEPSSRRKSTSKSVTCMHYLHFLHHDFRGGGK